MHTRSLWKWYPWILAGESYDDIRALADLIRIVKIPNIALMLQSCLGGSAPGFHVKFQSDRHFHFLVSCKSVGFKVYNLRCFVGACFDVYFHLWSNGAPHWEREKFLWEQEQEREWITVNSCRNKKPSQATPEPDVFVLLPNSCSLLQFASISHWKLVIPWWLVPSQSRLLLISTMSFRGFVWINMAVLHHSQIR